MVSLRRCRRRLTTTTNPSSSATATSRTLITSESGRPIEGCTQIAPAATMKPVNSPPARPMYSDAGRRL